MPKPVSVADLASAFVSAVGIPEPRKGTPELEVKFGTGKGYGAISGAASDRAVSRLLSLGFSASPASHLLRVAETGRPQGPRPPRVQISGMRDISAFCQSNKLNVEGGGRRATHFESKTPMGRGLFPVDNPGFEFRTTLQREMIMPSTSKEVRALLVRWPTAEKHYRYMNRVTLRSQDFPVRVDVSVVKSARGKELVQSGLLARPALHEIEIEVEPSGVGVGTKYPDGKAVERMLMRVTTFVLQGLQGTNYPVSVSEQRQTLAAYAALAGVPGPTERGMPSWAFVGPSSVTLQVDNVAPRNPAATLVNVREGYTVTDKADGTRKLLWIGAGGKVSMIGTNMDLQYTGAVADVGLEGTILDGEHITHDKDGKYINLYAAFDAYWVSGTSVRDLPFVAPPGEPSRLVSLTKAVGGARLRAGMADRPTPLRLASKTFEIAGGSKSIFTACADVLRREADGLIEYETDGLIFTPAHMAVGASKRGERAPKPKKATWTHSFKWKPPDQNTIDFLVVLKKAAGSDQPATGTMFQAGTDVGAAKQLTQYQTAVLCVGHDARQRTVNACQEMLDRGAEESIAQQVRAPGLNAGSSYKPVRFFPVQPYDPEAGECRLLVTPGAGGESALLAESGEVIEDQSIVEFRYDPERKAAWRWVPLRVRHDKTADLRSGGRNFGNNEAVANSNWRSLHNPVTEEMLKTGLGIPDEIANDEVYYDRKGSGTATRGLRDFHNKYVKHRLIVGVAKPGSTLVDLAVGKAGDLSKWTDAGVKYVLGVDISRDNVHNPKDGACARYLRYGRSMKGVPGALFTQGDSSRNVRSGAAFSTDRDKKRVAALFGKGPRSKSQLEPAVYDAYGVASNGFDTASMQFAIHYVWRTAQELQGFLRNIAETTAVGACFVGTCFDGNKVFNMLSDKKDGGSVAFTQAGERLGEITKRFDRAEYAPDASCVGYAIDVYQESINKVFREYLVNPAYLTRLMENYGFAPLTPEEVKDAGLPSSMGGFKELYGQMTREVAADRSLARRYGAATKMSAREKDISFLNMFFVFKKVRSVDAESVMYGLLGDSVGSIALKEETRMQTQADDAAAVAESAPDLGRSARARRPGQGSMARKTGRKLKLVSRLSPPE